MINRIQYRAKLIFALSMFLTAGCTAFSDKLVEAGREPVIVPDYSGATIPRNIAPLNFRINEKGRSFRLIASSSGGFQISQKSLNGIIRFPARSWKKLL